MKRNSSKAGIQVKTRSLWTQVAREIVKSKTSLASLVVVILLLLMAIFAPIITPYRYDQAIFTEAHQPPSWKHLMGTDMIGRDLLSRVIYGARISISIGVIVQLIGLAIGMPLGLIAGFYGGLIDQLIMRFVDAMLAFPILLIVILIMVVLGPGYINVLIGLGMTSWLQICRLTRGGVLDVRESEFVIAARASGASDFHIILKHIIPNILSPIIVTVVLGIPQAIFREASLSFIGIGINPPTPSWGQMVGEYYLMIQAYWWMPLFPALMIGITMVSFTLVGDKLQDALGLGRK